MSLPAARRREEVRCWLCGVPGIPGRTLRADVHLSAHLCPPCWGAQPRGRSSWVRAASALYAVLDLPRSWHEGFRTAWLQDTAHRHGIRAWYDAAQLQPRPPAPDDRFDWIPPDVLEAAAAELEAAEEEFQRSRIPPAPSWPGRPRMERPGGR